MFIVSINHEDSTSNTVELDVFGTSHTANYAQVEAELERWKDENGYSSWTVDQDMSRVGVGITRDGAGTGHAAKFAASISR